MLPTYPSITTNNPLLDHPRSIARGVLLIGDVAHASSPILGRGGCLAMENGAVLAEIPQAGRRLLEFEHVNHSPESGATLHLTRL